MSSVFPDWLIILVGILVAIAIVGGIYKIIAYRRVSVAAKKMDYLLEDLIYKSEFMVPTVEALVKLSSYVDLIEGIVKKNSDNISEYVKSNKTTTDNLKKTSKEVIKESK